MTNTPRDGDSITSLERLRELVFISLVRLWVHLNSLGERHMTGNMPSSAHPAPRQHQGSLPALLAPLEMQYSESSPW